MEIKRNKKISKKTIGIITFAVILIAAGMGAYYFMHHRQNDTSSQTRDVNSVDYGKASDSQIQAGQTTKNNNSSGTSTDTPPSPSTQPGSTKATAQVAITAKNQTSQTYQIRAQIDGLLTNGTCTLTLTNGPSTVTKKAEVQNLSSTSTCMGFDVPLSELSVGTWQVTLIADSATVTGSVTNSIVVK